MQEKADEEMKLFDKREMLETQIAKHQSDLKSKRDIKQMMVDKLDKAKQLLEMKQKHLESKRKKLKEMKGKLEDLENRKKEVDEEYRRVTINTEFDSSRMNDTMEGMESEQAILNEIQSMEHQI